MWFVRIDFMELEQIQLAALLFCRNRYSFPEIFPEREKMNNYSENIYYTFLCS